MTRINLLTSAALPSGVAATDTANVQAAIDAASLAGGGDVALAAGTYVVSGLTIRSNVQLRGRGRAATVIMLAAGSVNKDVIVGANFATLSLGGTTGGIYGWRVSDLTIDGNGINVSGNSYGLRVYGADYIVSNVSFRNARNYGLYTEWADSASGAGLPDGSMEAQFTNLRIHDNNVATGNGGWLHRGPHDAQVVNVVVANNNGGRGIWAQSPQTCALTSGSNGVDLSTFTVGSPGTLNVTCTIGWPGASLSATQGSVTVPTALIPVNMTYTSKDDTHFFGCVAQGSPAGGSTVSTNAACTTQGYAASGSAFTQVHVWGQHSIAWTLDTWAACMGCAAEGAATGQVLMRCNETSWIGGNVFYLVGGPTGYGIQIGDTAISAGGLNINTQLDNFAGTAASSAAIYFANSNSCNRVTANLYQPSGTPVWGTPGSTDAVDIRVSGFGSIQANARACVVTLAPPVTGLLEGVTSTGTGTVVSGSMLGYTQRAPTTRTVSVVSTTALAAFDTTNLTVSFVAPPSGIVEIEFAAVMSCASTAVTAYLGFAGHGGTTVAAGSSLVAFVFAGTGATPVVFGQVVSALTPGQAYQYDLVGAVSTGATNLNVIAFSNATPGGSSGGPVTVKVRAL